MPDPQPLDEVFQVEIAALSETGRDDVLEALNAHPDMTQDEAHDLLDRTERADEARDNFDALQKDQEQLMKDGDWETAHDRAHEAEYEMREVEDLGGHAETEIHEAQADQADIDDAIHQQDAAHQAAHDSADFAAHGMDGAAEVYGNSATDHAVAATDSAVAATPDTSVDHHVDDAAATTD